jgi:hypothetical protein
LIFNFLFVEKNNIKRPLDYLLSNDLEVVSSAVVENLLSQEKISYMCTAKLVHPWQIIKCEVLISENAIYIVPAASVHNKLNKNVN